MVDDRPNEESERETDYSDAVVSSNVTVGWMNDDDSCDCSLKILMMSSNVYLERIYCCFI